MGNVMAKRPLREPITLTDWFAPDSVRATVPSHIVRFGLVAAETEDDADRGALEYWQKCVKLRASGAIEEALDAAAHADTFDTLRMMYALRRIGFRAGLCARAPEDAFPSLEVVARWADSEIGAGQDEVGEIAASAMALFKAHTGPVIAAKDERIRELEARLSAIDSAARSYETAVDAVAVTRAMANAKLGALVSPPWFSARWPGDTWPSRELARAARLERRKARRAEADNWRTSLDSVGGWTF